MRDSEPSFEMAATFSVLTVQLLEDPCFPASPASSLVHLGTITAQICISGHPLTADCSSFTRKKDGGRGLLTPVQNFITC